jgi:hypothetical protein
VVCLADAQNVVKESFSKVICAQFQIAPIAVKTLHHKEQTTFPHI